MVAIWSANFVGYPTVRGSSRAAFPMAVIAGGVDHAIYDPDALAFIDFINDPIREALGETPADISARIATGI
jgi:hypothetical protein